jgi:UrcA family protein
MFSEDRTERNLTMKILFAIVAMAVSTALFVGATPVQAASITRQAVVNYSDLNLSREAGARELIRRLEAAAWRACGGAPIFGDYRAWAAHHACTKNAMNDAVANVDQPLVDSLYGLQPRRMAGK